ncbi:MAG: hypothetical protein CMJ59_04905 [Planctomycetaceae bacterium]|nr:hypothetical protein [Planctomycetaceae bacterium]
MQSSLDLSGQQTQPSMRVSLFLCASLLVGTVLPTAASHREPPTKKPAVQLIVDYGDGVQKHFTSLPWKAGMTALDALNLAQQHPRGIRFSYRGKGPRGFLTSIDGLKNDGQSKNWIYRLNGKLGDRSFAIQPLQVGDGILWKFGKYK